MRRKRVINIVGAVMGLSIIVAASVLQPATAQAQQGKTKIGVATVAPTMGSYPAIVALADYLNKNTSLDLTVSSVAGSTAIPTSVEKMNETGLGMGFVLPVGMLLSAYEGTIEYKGKPNRSLRMMIMNYWEYRGVYTVPATGITSISQAKGKRFPRFTRTRNAEYPPVFEAYGVDYNSDLKLINIPSPGAAADALGVGRLDLAGGTVAGSKIVELKEATGGVIVLPIEPGKFAQAKAKHPADLAGFDSVILPPGEVPGVSNEQPTPVMDFKMASFANKDIPDEVVYTYVKRLLDNFEEIRGLQRLFKKFSLESAAPLFGVPYHPGAIKAFQEKGLWTAALEQQQQQLLKR